MKLYFKVIQIFVNIKNSFWYFWTLKTLQNFIYQWRISKNTTILLFLCFVEPIYDIAISNDSKLYKLFKVFTLDRNVKHHKNNSLHFNWVKQIYSALYFVEIRRTIRISGN